MCQLKSGIILKDRIYIGEGDSHTDMLTELGIEDSRKNAETLFVRAELIPPNDDIFSDINTWSFNVDQDIRPDWFVEPYEKERMVKAVKEWADKHVLLGRKNEKISNGTYYLKDCIDITFNNSTVKAFDNSTVVAYDNSTVKAFDNSTVKACGTSTVKAFDNSTVKACGTSTVVAYNNSTVKAFDNSTVKAWSNSTVVAYGNSTVKAFDNSTVVAYGNSTVKAFDNSTVIIPNRSNNKRDNIILMINSTLKDCKTKNIYQSGDWQFVKVEEDNEKVK